MSVLTSVRTPALAAAMAVSLAGSFAGPWPAAAQETPRLDLEHGALLIHGNFCGPGNRGPNHPPVDALDVACMHHDSCSPPRGEIPRCACNDRLHAEAGLVAGDPATSEEVRQTAQFIADSALILPCED